jgi:hypothetical protein
MRKSERLAWTNLANALRSRNEANKPTCCDYCWKTEPKWALVPTKRGPLMCRKCAVQSGQLIGS